MGTIIPQTTFEVFDAGIYRAKLAATAIEDGEYGKELAVRFDLTEQGFEDKSIRAWASAKLSGGKRPSKLYGWTSVLLFNGKPLPEGFELDIDNLIGREALLVLDVVQKDGIDRNRVAQLLPLRRNGSTPAQTAAADDRSMLKPRSGVTILSQPVPANAPDDVPAWLNGSGDGVDELP
jgi:hypothetical protein